MNLPPDYTSIIITTFISNEMRQGMFSLSLTSLIKTTQDLPCEIIVVDNGGSDAVSKSLLALVAAGKIHTYVRNAENMHFGFGRNQGIAMARGNYICIADNDIHYNKGWLQACLAVLKAYPDKKIYATPLEYPTGVLKEKYDMGKLKVGVAEYNLNMRAGSNCFVIRRQDLDEIGYFYNHRIAGTKWTDDAVKKKYLAAVAPEGLVYDLGLRNGYNHSQPLPVKRTLTNREEVYFNEDEYRAV